jgi:hypothetical protein
MVALMGMEIKANELRRYAILTRTSITYRVHSSGETGVVNSKGIIHIPGISGRPSYNLEDLLARADEFEVSRENERPRTLTREAMIELLKQLSPAPTMTAKEE